jgi:hypothetical protein
MSLDLLLAQSLRRWKEDYVSVELKRYARCELGAETCILRPHSGSERPSLVQSSAVALFRRVQSLPSIARSRSVNENKLPAGKASISKSVKSPDIPSSSTTTEDVSTGLADHLIIGLGDENRRTAAEPASTTYSLRRGQRGGKAYEKRSRGMA